LENLRQVTDLSGTICIYVSRQKWSVDLPPLVIASDGGFAEKADQSSINPQKIL
jgi:hypothetical protein